jgi:3-isopropylmalate/(R)-2-methylmalate dehydratase small subunit
VLVGGRNFGCGSSREHAPLAIKASGISAIIAKSVARIFYRNSFNIGLPVLESEEAVDAIEEGDEISVDLTTGEIVSRSNNGRFFAKPIPEFMDKIIQAGGLVEFIKKESA